MNTALAPYLSIFLVDAFGFSLMEYGFFGVLLSSLHYLITPILFFVVLYMVCGGPLLDRIASVLISFVFGSLMGYAIGSTIGSVVVAVTLGQIYSSYYPLLHLPQHVVAQTLLGFAVLALSDAHMRWTRALPVEESEKSRPTGVTLLAAFYVVLALLNMVVVPLLATRSVDIGSFPHAALVLVALGVAYGLVIAGQFAVGVGLYYGKRWGWITAVISSSSSLVIDICALGGMIVLGSYAHSPTLALGLFVGLIGSLVVLLYLLSINVREFFAFINPRCTRS